MNVQTKPNVGGAQRHLPFECVALVLQGGGALGAYQAGVYEALAEANIHPDWVSGVSIGQSTPPLSPATHRATGLIGCARFGLTSRQRDYGPCSTTHSLSPGETPYATLSIR
jgi:Patatin-like phospholipase